MFLSPASLLMPGMFVLLGPSNVFHYGACRNSYGKSDAYNSKCVLWPSHQIFPQFIRRSI